MAVIEFNRTSFGNAIEVPLGVPGTFVKDIIKSGEETTNTEGAEVKFYMRPLLSRIPSINGAKGKPKWPTDEVGHNVEYEFKKADVASEGEYMGWWGFVLKGETAEQQTNEFPIVITDHGPGFGTNTGAIVDGAGDFMPVTFNALKNDPSFGDRRLQKYATLVQIRVLKTYVQPDEEVTAYELPLLDYLSKRTALALCTPGIDYWSRQPRTMNAVSPTEMVSFPDMISNLEKLRDRLVKELEENWREVQALFPTVAQRRVVPMPASSLEFFERAEPNGKLIRKNEVETPVTKDPSLYPKIETGWWGYYDMYAFGFFPPTNLPFP